MTDRAWSEDRVRQQTEHASPPRRSASPRPAPATLRPAQDPPTSPRRVVHTIVAQPSRDDWAHVRGLRHRARRRRRHWRCWCATASSRVVRSCCSLHGHPRTSATWHRVAPLLVAAGLSVVCADLPGYGRSRPAGTDPRPRPARQDGPRAAAARPRCRRSGTERFAVVGHDRGSYVAFRLALDHPDGGHPGRAARRHPDRRAPGTLRRAVRHRVVALVLLRAARGPGAGDQRRPAGLVRLRRRARWARRTRPSAAPRCRTPGSCAGCSRTTAPG